MVVAACSQSTGQDPGRPDQTTTDTQATPAEQPAPSEDTGQTENPPPVNRIRARPMPADEADHGRNRYDGRARRETPAGPVPGRARHPRA